MTTADRVSTRGRSLSDWWGYLPPNAGPRHPSPPSQLRRVANVPKPDAETQQDVEYTTYAPRGEKCRVCTAEFQSLERVRRATPPGRPSGVPSGRPYVHIECPDPGVTTP